MARCPFLGAVDGDRTGAATIMFGADQMVWPQTIAIAIDSIESAEYLTAEQKRDILYNNAARFLRLDGDEIARHHRF